MSVSFDMAVIGGGEAGIEAALRCAELGGKVVLLEKDYELGGTCVETGTLPSKIFRNAAKVLETLRKADKFGIRVCDNFGVEFREVVESKTRPTRCEMGMIDKLLRQHRVELIIGHTSFKDGSHLVVETGEGKKEVEASAPGIYAVGDVIGGKMMTSIAKMEALVAAENAMGGEKEVDYRFVPSGIYTDPEIGSVGLIEEMAFNHPTISEGLKEAAKRALLDEERK